MKNNYCTSRPNTLHPCIFFCLFWGMAFILLPTTSGQQKRETKKFFTGASPVVLAKDANEIVTQNTLTSFWIAYREFIPAFNATRIADRKRFSRFDQMLRVSHGFSQSDRWDLGLELRMAHVRLDEEAKSSPWKVLGGNDASGDSYRALSYAGIRARFMPFGSLPELTIQGVFNYPMARDKFKARQLNAERIQTGLMATFFQNLNDKTLYFLQAEWNTYFAGSDRDQTSHFASASGFLVIGLMDEQFYIFPGMTLGGSFQRYSAGGSFKQTTRQVYGGLGAQWQASNAFSIFMFLQRPFVLENGSQFSEWVRDSYSSVSLGLRLLI